MTAPIEKYLYFIIQRSTSEIFRIEGETLIDEVINEEYEYKTSVAWENPDFSEIPKSLYMSYFHDKTKAKAKADAQTAMDAFADAAIALNETWNTLDELRIQAPLEANYPFAKDFGEVMLNILSWQETATKWFKR